MREFPIQKFWYGKGAAYKDINELIEKNPEWFLWAVDTFQDVSPEQAQHFFDCYGMDLPLNVVAEQRLLDEVNGGVPYEYKKGDTEEVYMSLCKKYEELKNKYYVREEDSCYSSDR